MRVGSRKEREGEGEEGEGEVRRRRERQKRKKGKGEDESGKEKGEVSHDVLETATSSSWAHQAPEHSRQGNTQCMNWRESNGDHCKEVEMIRSVQCANMVKRLQ